MDSVLGQTRGDLELCISDNASTDETAEMVRERAARDARVKLFVQPRDAGIVANFNQAFEMSSGEYFRWIGGDDWLEPTYAEQCIPALEADSDLIGVTTHFRLWDSEGKFQVAEHTGQRVDGAQPHQRYRQCLSLLLDDYRYFDPMYSIHRRGVLRRTGLVRPVYRGDQLLAAELSLLGPWAHIPECLANRGKPRFGTQEQLLSLLRPPGSPPLSDSPELVFAQLLSILSRAPLSWSERLACYAATLRFYAAESDELRTPQVREGVAKVLVKVGLKRRASDASAS